MNRIKNNTLIFFVKRNSLEDVKNILSLSRAHINAKDDEGKTALMHASERGLVDILEILLKAGANPHLRDNSGHTAHSLAMSHGYHAIARKIEEKAVTLQIPTLSPPGRPLYPLYTSKTKSKLLPESIKMEYNRYMRTMKRNVAKLHEHDVPNKVYSAEKIIKHYFPTANVDAIGKGQFGTVYKIKLTPQDRLSIRHLYNSLSDRLEGHTFPILIHSTIVVKIMTPRNLKNPRNMKVADKKAVLYNHYEESSHDALIHSYLDNHKPIKLFDFGVLDVREFIPRFYFAGADVKHGAYVSVMEWREGVPLASGKVKIKSFAVADIERAFYTLHAFGVVHGDSHTNNILISPKTGKITIIDFGMSIRIPPTVQTRIIENLRETVSNLIENETWSTNAMNSVWDKDLRQYIDYIMNKKFSVSWYNPNVKLLRYMRYPYLTTQISKNTLDAARRRSWLKIII